MKAIIVPILAFLAILMVPGVLGASWTNSCLNDTAMIEESNLNISGTVYPITNVIDCMYNCSNTTQQCNDNPKETSPWGFVPIAIMFPLFSFIFVYIALNVGKKHSILGWFFVPMALLMMAIGIFSMVNYENSMNVKSILSDSGFIIIIALIVFFVYFLLFMLFTLMGKIGNTKKEPYGDNLKE